LQLQYNPVSYIGTHSKVKGETAIHDNTYLSSELWHNDNPCLKNPSHISVFQMVDSASQNWETDFISLHDICSNITEEIKLKWNSIYIMYSGSDVTHPLLWIHPFTGRQSIYFDFRFVKCNLRIWAAPPSPLIFPLQYFKVRIICSLSVS